MRVVLLAWLLAIIFCDLRWRFISNALIILGAGLALVAWIPGVQPFGIGITSSVTAGFIGFSFLMIFYILNAMGAGDVKFAGVLGLWVGSSALLPIWVIGSILAGLHAVVLLLRARHRPPPATRPPGRRPIPYAAYLSLGALAWMAGH